MGLPFGGRNEALGRFLERLVFLEVSYSKKSTDRLV